MTVLEVRVPPVAEVDGGTLRLKVFDVQDLVERVNVFAPYIRNATWVCVEEDGVRR